MVGFTSSTTVMLDLDDVSYEEAMIRGFKAVKDFRLKGFLLAESSRRHYHLVFNRRTSGSRAIGIISSICLKTRDEALTRWLLNQLTRGNFTLRISTKGKNSSPKIAFRYGKQDGEIQRYMQHRRLLEGKTLELISESQVMS